MRLKPESIQQHLQSGLQPVYLVTGDEPLTVMETSQAIRDSARAAGIDERLVFDVDTGFDWDSIGSGSDNLSLFSSRRLLDVRVPSGKPGREGSAALRELASRAEPGGDVLLITMPRLDKRTLATAWAKALDQAGVVIQVWPVALNRLPGWLDQRMRAAGLSPEPAACRALANRIEGNMLAAAQEIEKLALLCQGRSVTAADIEHLVADSARFDVYRLVDSALAGHAGRALRIARSLRSEDSPLPVVAWALTREVRLLSRLRAALKRGANLQPILRDNQVWDSRKQLVDRAMRRLSPQQWSGALAGCARLDRLVKGAEAGDPWLQVDWLLVLIATGEPALGRLGRAH
ncbi:MAG: DNA polymerase III subunit delta [Xanthomonadales bacterium]|nr:DNA polymerase III subunit delta [Xanthomonadales bacterium]